MFEIITENNTSLKVNSIELGRYISFSKVPFKVYDYTGEMIYQN